MLAFVERLFIVFFSAGVVILFHYLPEVGRQTPDQHDHAKNSIVLINRLR